jgi:hypothetical protein
MCLFFSFLFPWMANGYCGDQFLVCIQVLIFTLTSQEWKSSPNFPIQFIHYNCCYIRVPAVKHYVLETVFCIIKAYDIGFCC